MGRSAHDGVPLSTQIVFLEGKVQELTAELTQANGEAVALCMAIYNQHFKSISPDFELCNSTAGVISQIDNMVAGLFEDNQRLREAIKTAIDKLDSVAPERIEGAANQQTRKLAKALEEGE